MAALSPDISISSANCSAANSFLFSIEEIERKIQELVKENSDLRTTLQQNNAYIKQLSTTLIQWQDELFRVQSEYKEKFEKARDIIAKLKQENQELKVSQEPSATNSSANINVPIVVSFEERSPTSSNSLDSFVVVKNTTTKSPKQNETPLPDYDSLFSSKNLFEKGDPLVNQLQRDVDSLRHQLNAEIERNSNLKSLLNGAQSQLDQVMVDYEKISKKWEEKSRAKSDEDQAESDRRYMEAQEKIDGLLERVKRAEDMALSKQRQISELQQINAHLEREVVPLLKAQVEVYIADFHAERDARQSLAGEKDALQQQIRSLNRLLESTHSGTLHVATPQPSTSSYECPKCGFAFTTVEALNNHLDSCLSNDFMYP